MSSPPSSVQLGLLMSNDDTVAHADSGDDAHQQITAMVIAYLDGKDVPERGRGALISEVTGLSIQHARKRLTPNGPPWVVDELGKIARHFGDGLSDLLPFASTDAKLGNGQSCEIEIAGHWYGAQARVHGMTDGCRPGQMVAVRHHDRWRLVASEQVPPGTAAYEATHIALYPKPSQNIRVAILDDDVSVAKSLRDALIEGGFSASAFSFEGQLSDRLAEFDVFIIDFVLGEGKNACSIVEKIRGIKPLAPIALLTGHAREAASIEIAGLVRAHRVEVHEKPAQIIILESMIAGRLQERRTPSM